MILLYENDLGYILMVFMIFFWGGGGEHTIKIREKSTQIINICRKTFKALAKAEH